MWKRKKQLSLEITRNFKRPWNYLEHLFLPKISSYSLNGEWKMIFLKKKTKKHGNMVFSSNILKRWSFRKIWHWNMIFLVVLSGKMIFLFPEICSHSLDAKWKIIFLKKNTWKHDIFFKCPQKMVFPKIIALEYDIACIMWKDGIFSPGKYDIFSLNRKWKMIYVKKHVEK